MEAFRCDVADGAGWLWRLGHHGRRHRAAEDGAAKRLEKFDDDGGGVEGKRFVAK